MNTSAVLHGGDRVLCHWRNEPVGEHLKANQDAYDGEILVSYEDREEWVREALRLTDWQQFAELPIVKKRSALVLWIVIGQEEDRSSGFPVRYVKMAIAVLKTAAH